MGQDLSPKSFADHFDQFFGDVFFPELERRGIMSVVHLGDLMDRRKYSNHVAAARMLSCFIDRLKGRDLTIIPGNHDAPLRDSLETNAVELFLGHRDNIHVVQTPTFLPFGLLIPWICAENRDATNAAIAKAHKVGTRTVMGHFEMTGFERQRGQIADTGIDPEAFYGFECVLSGHYHHKSDKLNIHYLGAPYEMDWNDYDDPKGFHIFDTETLQLDFIRNSYRMHYKLEYDDRDVQPSVPDIELAGKIVKIIVHARTQPKVFEAFMRDLEKREPSNIAVMDNHLVELTEGKTEEAEVKDTREVLVACIDGMSDTVDKVRLKGLLEDLYQEAVRINA